MTNMIVSSLDKELSYLSNTESITLTPTLATQRFLAAYINEMLDTCEIDCTPSVQEFAEKFIGEPVGLAEGSLMMQLYENLMNSVGAKIAEQASKGDFSITKPEVLSTYYFAHLLYKVMTQDCLAFGLNSFDERMSESIRTTLESCPQV